MSRFTLNINMHFIMAMQDHVHQNKKLLPAAAESFVYIHHGTHARFLCFN